MLSSDRESKLPEATWMEMIPSIATGIIISSRNIPTSLKRMLFVETRSDRTPRRGAFLRTEFEAVFVNIVPPQNFLIVRENKPSVCLG
jgi:hypothetical protein